MTSDKGATGLATVKVFDVSIEEFFDTGKMYATLMCDAAGINLMLNSTSMIGFLRKVLNNTENPVSVDSVELMKLMFLVDRFYDKSVSFTFDGVADGGLFRVRMVIDARGEFNGWCYRWLTDPYVHTKVHGVPKNMRKLKAAKTLAFPDCQSSYDGWEDDDEEDEDEDDDRHYYPKKKMPTKTALKVGKKTKMKASKQPLLSLNPDEGS